MQLRDLPREGVPYVTEVGLFMLVRVIKDARADAIAAAKKHAKGRGYRVDDVANVSQVSGDEWLVELRLTDLAR